MKIFFNSWFAVSKKPFLNKNNRNSLCAPMLNKILENVHFVEIHRDPIYVAQSLVLSRRAVQGTDKIGWGLLSKDSNESNDSLTYIDDICNQVYQVDKTLALAREKIDSKKYIRVSYESFCENPGEVIKKIGHKTLNSTIDSRDFRSLKFSTSSNTQKLDDQEFSRICACIEDLYSRKITDNVNS
jgi:hypothetical protein